VIPARDEASGIADAVHAAVASEGVEIEVVVLDDHSTDDTAKIVTDLGRADRRVRLVHGKELPA
jgi:glycosyltransferase involved in cell wall biosynthesis